MVSIYLVLLIVVDSMLTCANTDTSNTFILVIVPNKNTITCQYYVYYSLSSSYYFLTIKWKSSTIRVYIYLDQNLLVHMIKSGYLFWLLNLSLVRCTIILNSIRFLCYQIYLCPVCTTSMHRMTPTTTIVMMTGLCFLLVY